MSYYTAEHSISNWGKTRERKGFFVYVFRIPPYALRLTPYGFYLLLTAAPHQPQLNRLPGRGAQEEPAPLSLLWGPPQEKADIIRWGFAAPHLGQAIFASLSETP
jgi:hypothetical protein